MSQKTKDWSEIATYLVLCEFIIGVFVICIIFPGICGVEEVDCSCAYGHWSNRCRGRGRRILSLERVGSSYCRMLIKSQETRDIAT